jgi:hypothetical protein
MQWEPEEAALSLAIIKNEKNPQACIIKDDSIP